MIKFSTPNINELLAIAASLGYRETELDNPTKNLYHVTEFVSKFIDNLFITLGENGILVARKHSSKSPILDYNKNNSLQIRRYPVEKMKSVVSVSGAGDCFAAGLISAMLKGLSEENCISAAVKSARSALMSEFTVPEQFENVDEIFRLFDYTKTE